MKFKRARYIIVFALIILLALTAYKWYFVQKVPVLLYHHILKEEENKLYKNNGYIISLEEFEEQMKYLYDNGFQTLTANDMEDFIYNEKPLPEKSVWITFDDGYYSNIYYAYPVLKKYGFKATIFVVTSYLMEVSEPFNPDLMNIINIHEIGDTLDVFEYASHTDNLHSIKNRKSAFQTASYDRVRDDLNTSISKDYITNKTVFAYPYGKYNKQGIKALEELGFKLGVTVKKGYVAKDSNPYLLKRITIGPDMPLERFKQYVDKKS